MSIPKSTSSTCGGLWIHLFSPWYEIALDLDLLDIDRNGKTDWIDLGLLGQHMYGVPTPPNTYGIGLPLTPEITASLSPEPTGFDFKDDGIWHRFTVNVRTASGAISDARVWVVVNATEETDLALEIAAGTRAPATSFCPGERDDTRQNLGDGDVVWISGCQEGTTNILVADNGHDHEVLTSYEIEILPDVETSFDIELVFTPGDFTTTQQSFIRRAADRWESIFTEGIPDLHTVFDSDTKDWWDGYTDLGRRVYVNETIDDLRIYVGRMRTGRQGWASGGGFLIRRDSKLPILAEVAIHRDVLAEAEHIIVNVVTHEVAHALGFGVIWDNLGLLGNPSDGRSTADTYFSGRGAIDAFNFAGGWSYPGMKVPSPAPAVHRGR